MRRLPVLIAFVVTVLMSLATSTRADSFSNITSVGDLGANASINWGQFGACVDEVASPSTVIATNGLSATASVFPLFGQETIQRNANGTGGCANDGWFGNFAPGDNLLWTEDNGPLFLSFSTPVAGVGMQIDGSDVATINVFTDNQILMPTATFSENVRGGFTADGSATFIGLLDLTGQNIRAVEITTPGRQDFAVDTVFLNAIPEPSTLLLLGTGIVLGAFKMRGRHLNS